MVMKRREATNLLRQIIDYPELTQFTCVYLKPNSQTQRRSREDFELHVKTNYDTSTRVVIERLALRQGLLVKEEPGGFLAIYTPERRILEVTA
jgi:hypothetical protein